jgi:hypothetical protein
MHLTEHKVFHRAAIKHVNRRHISLYRHTVIYNRNLSPSAVSSKVQTSVTKELPGSRETKSSVTKNIKKDQPIVSKEIKKERQQTTVSKDIRKRL